MEGVEIERTVYEPSVCIRIKLSLKLFPIFLMHSIKLIEYIKLKTYIKSQCVKHSVVAKKTLLTMMGFSMTLLQYMESGNADGLLSHAGSCLCDV